MKYKVIGQDGQPLMVFITGAGIGPYMWKHQEEYFKDYKRIVFNLPGHGDNSSEPFTTIEALGLNIIKIIKEESINGKAIVIGHSIGAQTLMWLLEHYSDYIDKAVVISGLNKPMKGISWLIKPLIHMSIPLIKYRGFAKLQAKELRLPDHMFADYYRDSLLISRETLINTINENLKFDFRKVRYYPKTLVIVGHQEKKMMKMSALKTKQIVGSRAVYEFRNAAHGIPYEKADDLNKLIDAFIRYHLKDFRNREVRKIN